METAKKTRKRRINVSDTAIVLMVNSEEVTISSLQLTINFDRIFATIYLSFFSAVVTQFNLYPLLSPPHFSIQTTRTH